MPLYQRSRFCQIHRQFCNLHACLINVCVLRRVRNLRCRPLNCSLTEAKIYLLLKTEFHSVYQCDVMSLYYFSFRHTPLAQAWGKLVAFSSSLFILFYFVLFCFILFALQMHCIRIATALHLHCIRIRYAYNLSL